MTTPQTKLLTKTQRQSIERLCTAINLIEQLVPAEQQRFSNQRKRTLEHTYATLRLHAGKLNFDLPRLSFMYDPKEYLKHAHLVADTLANQFAPEWRRCTKVTPTRARVLTEADYQARQGVIDTREGPAPFAVGDYLATDDLGEYPIRKTTIEERYTLVEPSDSEGWAIYRSTEIREARRMFRVFETDRGVIGLAGDYLMRGANGRTWPCAKTKFEQEYRWMEGEVQ